MTYTPAGTVEPWSGLAVAISADRMLVTSEGAALLLRLVGYEEQLARRDGIGLSPQLAGMREVMRAVAVARRPSGRTDVRDEDDLRPWRNDDDVTLGEAAKLLDRSPRQTRRLAASGALGPTRRAGPAWRLSRSEVVAYIVHREATP